MSSDVAAEFTSKMNKRVFFLHLERTQDIYTILENQANPKDAFAIMSHTHKETAVQEFKMFVLYRRIKWFDIMI